MSSKDTTPIHWLKIETVSNERQFIWQCSHGSLDILLEYVDKDKSKQTVLNEKEFAETVQGMGNEPRMGKSTTLTRLSEQKLKSNWVIRINLKDSQDAIEDLSLGFNAITIEQPANFLFKVGNFDPTDSTITKGLLEYKPLGTATNSSYPLLLAFDGFDEIRSGKGKVSSLLNFLKD